MCLEPLNPVICGIAELQVRNDFFVLRDSSADKVLLIKLTQLEDIKCLGLLFITLCAKGPHCVLNCPKCAKCVHSVPLRGH